jgi:hypothetical protein
MQNLTPRAVLLGLVAVVLVCALVSWAELVVAQIQIGILQFPPVVVGLFLFLIVGNAVLRRVLAPAALSPAEVATIYMMMLMAAMISSRGLMEKWLPALVTPNYFAAPENRWRTVFFPHIRKWAVPFDPGGAEKQPVALAFYEGLQPGEHIPWHLWVVPLLSWSVIVFAIFISFFCLAAIVRRQWVENERLTFPLTQIPVELSRLAPSFLGSRLAWAGIAVPVVVFSINGLGSIYPALPSITVAKELNSYLPLHRPWTDVNSITIFMSFAAMGFFYLLPTDLIFSLWFFFIFTRVQDLLASLAGMERTAAVIYPTNIIQAYQAMGAYFVLVAYLVRTSLPHLRQVLDRAVHKNPAIDDSNELLGYRSALAGLLASLAVAIVWCHLLGMSWWMAALEILVYTLVVAVVMARSVAECGLLMTETSFRPVEVVTLVSSKDFLGPSNLTALSFTDPVFTRDLRGLLLTAFLDSSKIADAVRLRRRSLAVAFASAGVVAIVSAAVMQLLIPYNKGAMSLYYYPYTGNALWQFKDNAANIQGAHYFDWRAPTFLIVGVVLTAFLAVMRVRYTWWPFHPIAYAVSPSWTMFVFWFPCFVAWAVKLLVLRYGGMRLYATARPFFLGLVLGEFGMAVAWTVYSFITRHPAPFFPWP